MYFLKKFFFLFGLLTLIFTGCQPSHTSPSQHLITQVDVTCTREAAMFEKHFTAPEKMSSVLNYIRLLEGHGPPKTDPERIRGDVFKIILQFSDGQQQVYYQRADTYLSRCCGPWETIEPDQGSQLYPMIVGMSSDL